jgi:glycosyltransferase involved in cell wall biosynthesis
MVNALVPTTISIIPSVPIRGVYYIGQYGTSGYASAARGYLYHYFSCGIPITWEPLYFDNSKLNDDDPYDIIVKSLINRSLNNIEMVIMHSTPDLWPTFWNKKGDLFAGRVVNGYCTWETNRLPAAWVTSINGHVNEVWCPSTYNEQTFKESGVTVPIRVVPHVFLPKPLPSPTCVKLTDITNGDRIEKSGIYTFYTIGEFNARKSIEETIQAFCMAFKKNDPVRLILKVHYRNYSPENKNKCEEMVRVELKKYNNHPPVFCLFDNMSAAEILGLHSIGDCYLSLTKSEGFGLTIFDAFNYKKNVIATGYSGHIDFLGKNYPGLVRYKLGPVRGMSSFSVNYTEEQMWAYPDIDHAITLMRKAANI